MWPYVYLRQLLKDKMSNSMQRQAFSQRYALDIDVWNETSTSVALAQHATNRYFFLLSSPLLAFESGVSMMSSGSSVHTRDGLLIWPHALSTKGKLRCSWRWPRQWAHTSSQMLWCHSQMSSMPAGRSLHCHREQHHTIAFIQCLFLFVSYRAYILIHTQFAYILCAAPRHRTS